uniref:Trypsin-like peptidase domain-containing protein n=1 Tax=Natrinema zhouii TaxID=1710539 RepID=A0A7D6CR03_9EURY
MDRTSRRDILKISSTAIVAGLAGCTDTDGFFAPSNTTENAENDAQRERIEELEDRIESKNERIEALHREESISEFSTDIVEQAEAMAKAARESVVTVSGDRAGGTGWVLDATKGHVVTNSHVVTGDESFSIETFGGDTGSATRVGYYREMIPDVALLQTDLDGLQELPTGDESTLRPGDPLVTIGHPGSIGNWIMSMGRHEEYDARFETLYSTVPTSQGNSGGPLLTLEGDVVGIVSGSRVPERGGEGDFSKSEVVYTQLPEPERSTTSAPVETLLESVDEWT